MGQANLVRVQDTPREQQVMLHSCGLETGLSTFVTGLTEEVYVYAYKESWEIQRSEALE